MRRCGRVLVVITIIAIMAGGILLTDNNMRELQGMEKSHPSFNGKILSSYIKNVYKKVYTRAVRAGLDTWCDMIMEASADLIKSIQETMDQRFSAEP
ncbi:MAG: hypothetical protein RQM95_13165 [Syntrophaceticus schinkii]|nr:hypothetical protein [Syntrophaceticus schinkii]MDD4260918.1 hypothetical protein [Syntrophaceticus schinkii]MDD4674262.1 hypothetical protein [Syntrophaceticus schinkii]